jgi:argininosuccinate lyase
MPDDEPLWSGRFTKPPAPEAAALGSSIAFDVRLAPQDLEVSVVHVRGLEDAGLVDADEAAALEKALRTVGEQIAAGTFAFAAADEDVHSAIERGVTELLGDAGAKLHSGRSRNDLVVTDLRLWLLAARGRSDAGVVRLLRSLLGHAGRHAETVMPGTTHGHPAQPVTLGHSLLAHAWPLARDLDRSAAWARRASESPLGAGALATSTLHLDPERAAARLGFSGTFANSIDAVSDRDFAQEYLAWATILGTHLSRLAADLLRWSDPVRAWVMIDDAYATGSSMMPQKRNPDVAELTRAKAGRLLGAFATLGSVLNGLPLGYQRDLQEDKEAVFDAADTLDTVLPAIAGCVETLRFDVEAMGRDAADPALFATDIAEALVRLGIPFRDAHRRIGELIARLEAEGRSLADLSAEEWREAGVPEGASLLDPARSVRARSGSGGPSPQSVRDQISALEARLGHRGADA